VNIDMMIMYIIVEAPEYAYLVKPCSLKSR
jgi:hypothetical protein